MRRIPLPLWALAVLSGILQVLPFPIAGPTPLWRTAFCWVAILPLLIALLGKDKTGHSLTLGQGAALGYACGFVWYMGNCYWIYQTMYLYGGLAKPIAAGILVLFCLYLGLYHALFGTLVAAFHNRFGRQEALLLVPFAWVAVELARARITGLPWDLLGIAQVDNLLLTRIAPITGAYGLSFVIASVNAVWLVRVRVRERRFTRPALTAAGVVLVILYVVLLHRVAAPNQEPTRATATLVQENLEVGAANTGPQLTTQEFIDSFSYLSRYPSTRFLLGIPELSGTQSVVILRQPLFPEGAESASPVPTPTDLIVWPESPAPFEDSDPQFRAGMSALARATRTPIIVGNVGVEASSANKAGYTLYNRASFITPDGTFAGHYDKMHLVPFGEYTPYKDLFFFAKNLLNEVGTFEPGRQRTVFSSGWPHLRHLHLLRIHLRRRDARVRPAGSRGPRKYIERRLVRRHQRRLAASEYGPYACDRKSSLDTSCHQHGSHRGDQSVRSSYRCRSTTHPHEHSRALRLRARPDVLRQPRRPLRLCLRPGHRARPCTQPEFQIAAG